MSLTRHRLCSTFDEKMKLKKPIILLIACGAIFIGWNLGLIPDFRDPDRLAIRHALNISSLPDSLRINATGKESWTDYMFEADLSVDPQDFQQLVSKREFMKAPRSTFRPSHTRALRMQDYEGFEYDEIWSWADETEIEENRFPTSCKIMVTKEHDRLYLVYRTE